MGNLPPVEGQGVGAPRAAAFVRSGVELGVTVAVLAMGVSACGQEAYSQQHKLNEVQSIQAQWKTSKELANALLNPSPLIPDTVSSEDDGLAYFMIQPGEAILFKYQQSGVNVTPTPGGSGEAQGTPADNEQIIITVNSTDKPILGSLNTHGIKNVTAIAAGGTAAQVVLEDPSSFADIVFKDIKTADPHLNNSRIQITNILGVGHSDTIVDRSDNNILQAP